MHEAQESLVVDLRVHARDVAATFEDALQPQLHLLVEVKFLKVVDEAQRVDSSGCFFQLADESKAASSGFWYFSISLSSAADSKQK